MDAIHRFFGRGEHTSDASPAERLAALKRKYAALLNRLEQDTLDMEMQIEGEALVVRGTVVNQRLRDELCALASRIDENGLDLELHLYVDDGFWHFSRHIHRR